MFIWEWVLGWLGTGEVVIFTKVGKVARTFDTRPAAKTFYNRAVVKTNYNRDFT